MVGRNVELELLLEVLYEVGLRRETAHVLLREDLLPLLRHRVGVYVGVDLHLPVLSTKLKLIAQPLALGRTAGRGGRGRDSERVRRRHALAVGSAAEEDSERELLTLTKLRTKISIWPAACSLGLVLWLWLRLVAGPLDAVVAGVAAAVLAAVVLRDALDADPLLALFADGHSGGREALVGSVVCVDGLAGRALYEGDVWLLWHDIACDLDLDGNLRVRRDRDVEHRASD